MEKAVGVQLHREWPRMAQYDHLQTIQSISRLIKEMADLEFPVYGSIYFADAPIDSKLKVALTDEYCIGPHCGSTYWNCSLGENELYGNSGGDHGPCKWPRRCCRTT